MDESLWTVRQQDCVEGLKQLPAGSVDLAFADPPFNIGYDYDVYDDRQKREVYLDWCRSWIEPVHRVLKPSGTFWLAIGDEFAAELKVQSQEIGFHCRSWVIWYYTFGVNCTHKFSRSHAHLFHFVKDPKSFTFRQDDPQIRVPSARQLVYADARANPAGRLPDDTWILRPQDLSDGFTEGEDTWYFPRVAGRSRSGPACTAARCPNNCWAASSAPAPTKANSCSTRLPAAPRRWSSPKNSAAAVSVSSSAKSTPAGDSPGSSKPASAIRSKER